MERMGAQVTTTRHGYAIQHRSNPGVFLGEHGEEQSMPMLISAAFYAKEHIKRAKDRSVWDVVQCHVSIQCNKPIVGDQW